MLCNVCDSCEHIFKDRQELKYEIKIDVIKDGFYSASNTFHLCKECYKKLMPKFIQEKK